MCKKLSRLLLLMSVSMPMIPSEQPSPSATPAQAQSRTRFDIELTKAGESTNPHFCSSANEIRVFNYKGDSLRLSFDPITLSPESTYTYTFFLNSQKKTFILKTDETDVRRFLEVDSGVGGFVDGKDPVEILFSFASDLPDLEVISAGSDPAASPPPASGAAASSSGAAPSSGAARTSLVFSIIHEEVTHARGKVNEELERIAVSKANFVKTKPNPTQPLTKKEISKYVEAEALWFLVEALKSPVFDSMTFEEKCVLTSKAFNARDIKSVNNVFQLIENSIAEVEIDPGKATQLVDKAKKNLNAAKKKAPTLQETLKNLDELLEQIKKAKLSYKQVVIIESLIGKSSAWKDGYLPGIKNDIENYKFMLENHDTDLSFKELLQYRIAPPKECQEMLIILFRDIRGVSDRPLCFLLRDYEKRVLKNLTGITDGPYTPYWWTQGQPTPGRFFTAQNWPELLAEHKAGFDTAPRSYGQGERPQINADLETDYNSNEQEFYLYILGGDEVLWKLVQDAVDAIGSLKEVINSLPQDVDCTVRSMYCRVLDELTCDQPDVRNLRLLLCLALSLQYKFLAPWVRLFKDYLEVFVKKMESLIISDPFRSQKIEEFVVSMYIHPNIKLSTAKHDPKDVMAPLKGKDLAEKMLFASTATPLCVLEQPLNPIKHSKLNQSRFEGQDSTTMDLLEDRFGEHKLSCLAGFSGIIVFKDASASADTIAVKKRLPAERIRLLEAMVVRLKLGAHGMGQLPPADYMSLVSPGLVLTEEGAFVRPDQVTENNGRLTALNAKLLTTLKAKSTNPGLTNPNNDPKTILDFSSLGEESPEEQTFADIKLEEPITNMRLPDSGGMFNGIPEINAGLSVYFFVMYIFCTLLLNKFAPDLVGLSVFVISINAITKNLPVFSIPFGIQIPKGSAFIVYSIKQFSYAIVASLLLLMTAYCMPFWLVESIVSTLECLAMGVMIANILSVEKMSSKIFICLAFASAPFLSPYFMMYLYPYIPSRLINSLSVWYLKTLGEPFEALVVLGYCYNALYLMHLITILKNYPNDSVSFMNFILLCGISCAIIGYDFTITTKYVLLLLTILTYTAKAALDLPREGVNKLSIEHLPYENGDPSAIMKAAMIAGMDRVEGLYAKFSWRLFYLPDWYENSKPRVKEELKEEQKKFLDATEFSFDISSNLEESLKENLEAFGKFQDQSVPEYTQMGKLLDLYAMFRKIRDLKTQLQSKSEPTEPFHLALQKLHEQREGLLGKKFWCIDLRTEDGADIEAEGFITRANLIKAYGEYAMPRPGVTTSVPENYCTQAFELFANAEIELIQSLLSEHFDPKRPHSKFYLDYVCAPKCFEDYRTEKGDYIAEDLILLAETVAEITKRHFISGHLPQIMTDEEPGLQEESPLTDKLELRIAKRTATIAEKPCKANLALYDLAERATDSSDPMTRLSIEWELAYQEVVLKQFKPDQFATQKEKDMARRIVRTMPPNPATDLTGSEVAALVYPLFVSSSDGTSVFFKSPKFADIFRKFGNYCLINGYPEAAQVWFKLAFQCLPSITDHDPIKTAEEICYMKSYCARFYGLLHENLDEKLSWLNHSTVALETFYSKLCSIIASPTDASEKAAAIKKKAVVARDIIEALEMIQKQVDLFPYSDAELQAAICIYNSYSPSSPSNPATQVRDPKLRVYINIWKNIVTSPIATTTTPVTMDGSQSYLQKVIAGRALSPWELAMVLYAEDAPKTEPYFAWVKEKVCATAIMTKATHPIVTFSSETTATSQIEISGTFESTPPPSDQYKYIYYPLLKQTRPFDPKNYDPKEVIRGTAVNIMLGILDHSGALEVMVTSTNSNTARIKLDPFKPILVGLNEYTADESGRGLLSEPMLKFLMKKPTIESDEEKTEAKAASLKYANLQKVFAKFLQAGEYNLDIIISTTYAKLGAIWNANWIRPGEVRTLLNCIPAILLANCLEESERPGFWKQALSKNETAVRFFDPTKIRSCLDRVVSQNRNAAIEESKPGSKYQAILDIFAPIQEAAIFSDESSQRQRTLRITIAVMLTCLQFLPASSEYWQYYLLIWAAWDKSNPNESGTMPNLRQVMLLLNEINQENLRNLATLVRLCGVDLNYDPTGCKALSGKEAMLVGATMVRAVQLT